MTSRTTSDRRRSRHADGRFAPESHPEAEVELAVASLPPARRGLVLDRLRLLSARPPSGRGDDPVPADDARIASGEVFDAVMYRGCVLERLRPGKVVGSPTMVRLQFEQDLDDDRLYTVRDLVAYFLRPCGPGPNAGGPQRDSPRSLVVPLPELGRRARHLEDRLVPGVQEALHLGGSPVRRDGTRLIDYDGPRPVGYWFDRMHDEREMQDPAQES